MVECTGLENRRWETIRGFESLPVRSFLTAEGAEYAEDEGIGVAEAEVSEEATFLCISALSAISASSAVIINFGVRQAFGDDADLFVGDFAF